VRGEVSHPYKTTGKMIANNNVFYSFVTKYHILFTLEAGTIEFVWQ
jgi:hypothetical protein